MSDSISADDKLLLKGLWTTAAQIEAAPAGPEKAAFRGVNLRLNLLKALQATWETIKVAAKVKLALYVPPDLATMIEIGAESVSAAQTIYESLVQEMRPIDYVAYVVLAEKPNGITKVEFEAAINDFLDTRTDYDQVSWYLRISSMRLDRARQARQGQWIDTVLEKLGESDMIGHDGDRITFKSRNFKFGWEPG